MRKAPGTLLTFLGHRSHFCGGYSNSNLANYPCNSFSIEIQFHEDCSLIFTKTNVFSLLVLIKQICLQELPRNQLNASIKRTA